MFGGGGCGGGERESVFSPKKLVAGCLPFLQRFKDEARLIEKKEYCASE